MVLENLLGITDEIELAHEEERISKRQALRIYEENLLDEYRPGSNEALMRIHDILFSEIYPFAGKIRYENIAKGNFRFAAEMYLESVLASVEKMPDSKFEEIIQKYIEMNVAHPFREGNGRSMRIWLDHLLKARIGKVIDWQLVDKRLYLMAMERSPVYDLEIRMLLKEALTDKIDDREVFIKGIDASYAYEGYTCYKLSELTDKEV